MINFAELLAVIDDRLIALIILTAIDFILGVVLALVHKTFSWEKLTGYIESDLLPILAWLAVEVISALPQDVVPSGAVNVVPLVVYSTVFLKITASILSHVSNMGVARGLLGRVGIESDRG